ncbi:MAG: lipoyl(octanoyl) transferase LipB [Dehalococcoidia bacterium]|nr:lipoyl(octanoyl) transferase LipB [Dehalococcoidia bacterium]
MVSELGLVPYGEAWALQKRLVEQRQAGSLPDTLLLLEHPHVYTLGRRGQDAEVLASQEELARLGAMVYHVDRGGLATYHGPGQLVGYAILDLRALGIGPVQYVHSLEQVLIKAAAGLGVAASCNQAGVGVWVGARKLAAIGVRVSRGVTSHGFALNVNTDLSYFDRIVPCGMPDKQPTSLAQELGAPVKMEEVRKAVTAAWAEEFGMTMLPASASTR